LITKKVYLFCIICSLLVLLVGCGNITEYNGQNPIIARLGLSMPMTSSNNSDQIVKPNAIILHTGSKNLVIEKGIQFDKIVSLTNARLKGAELNISLAWADFNFVPTLSGIDNLEFDYSKVQTLSFEFDGVNPGGPALRPGEKPSVYHTEVKFTKLIFPLNDNPNGSKGYKYSLSFFSNGSPGDKVNINGKVGLPINQNYPIGSPDALTDYMKGLGK